MLVRTGSDEVNPDRDSAEEWLTDANEVNSSEREGLTKI
jgi:hypothetical protein